MFRGRHRGGAFALAEHCGELPFGRVEGEREDARGEMVDGFTLAEFIRWGREGGPRLGVQILVFTLEEFVE